MTGTMVTYQNADCPARLGHMVNTLTGEAYLARCKAWSCFACGPIKRRQFVARVRSGGDYTHLITLTLEGDVSDLKDVGRRLARGFRKLYHWLRRVAGLGHYAWVREFGEKGGRPHLHAIINAGRFDYGQARAVIQKAGLGRVCDFQRLRTKRGGCRYVAKYLTKGIHGVHLPRYFRRAQTSVAAVRRATTGWVFVPRALYRKPTKWSEAWSGPQVLESELNPEPWQLSLALTKKEKLCATDAGFYDPG